MQLIVHIPNQLVEEFNFEAEHYSDFQEREIYFIQEPKRYVTAFHCTVESKVEQRIVDGFVDDFLQRNC